MKKLTRHLSPPFQFFLLLPFVITLYGTVYSEGKFFDLENDQQQVSIPFRFINNFIVIDVHVNNHPQKFIVDTGFATPILFEVQNHPNIKIENREVLFSGVGQGKPVVGNWAMEVDIKISGIYCDKIALIALSRADLAIDGNFKIDGVIGFQLFNSLVVHIDYQSELLHFYRPEQFEAPSDFSSHDLEIDYTKPYIYLKYHNGLAQDSAKLLLDLGANLTIMLFDKSPLAKITVYSNRKSIIGYGLSGAIRGRNIKIPTMHLAGFSIENTSGYLVDTETYGLAKDLINRQGSIGNKFLKDFEVIINYIDQKIYLKPITIRSDLLAKK